MSDPPSSTSEVSIQPIDPPWIPKGPSFLPTFLYYFSGTALVTTLFAIKTLGVGMETGIPSQFGLLVGGVGGLVGAYFNHSQLLKIPFSDRKVFLAQLEPLLAAKGYHREEVGREGVQVYQRQALRHLFSGKIYVHTGAQQATFSGRAVHLRSLKKQLG